jgi:hypothetical protein
MSGLARVFLRFQYSTWRHDRIVAAIALAQGRALKTLGDATLANWFCSANIHIGQEWIAVRRKAIEAASSRTEC